MLVRALRSVLHCLAVLYDVVTENIMLERVLRRKVAHDVPLARIVVTEDIMLERAL